MTNSERLQSLVEGLNENDRKLLESVLCCNEELENKINNAGLGSSSLAQDLDGKRPRTLTKKPGRAFYKI